MSVLDAATGNVDDLTFIIDLTENSASAITCLFTVDRILKLSISANCSYCGNIINNEGKLSIYFIFAFFITNMTAHV